MPGRDGTSLVLLVDDEEIIADTLSLILNQSGFDARAVYSGETAIVLARQLRPDVLISDVLMRGMTGIDLALLVEKELPDCRIILYSGQSVAADLLTFAETDGHHFELLSKPVHPEVLIKHLVEPRTRDAKALLAETSESIEIRSEMRKGHPPATGQQADLSLRSAMNIDMGRLRTR